MARKNMKIDKKENKFIHGWNFRSYNENWHVTNYPVLDEDSSATFDVIQAKNFIVAITVQN